MRNLWSNIEYCSDFSSIRKKWYSSTNEIIDNIDDWVEDQDHIMMKASNSIGFNKIIEYIKKQNFK